MSINYGENIKKQRTIKGLSQAELGAKLGLKHGAISSWENNRTQPNMGQIEQMCIVLGCRKSDLIGETNFDRLSLLNTIEIEMDSLADFQLDRLIKYAEYLKALRNSERHED